ncbi:hypothetical protein A3F28_00860 [Candidatus Uhrbacteria bacterium RIFCSPHIGHO2_12_FULL_57_11]|uniref:Uncharacterized protein n=1 Tax=Candidatus Uhrbacteria bacterium RIFCSPHIGHO2_12_FULL_57_11 TaxID=1802398 RepID=A0A1F7UI56_9BACT|nr:MAG: hypothetical protein A3F28_00860 [Candidatus Uhrbacteria bacterium RIFCSPHIGHO2_12_FULL_57_11]
MALPSSEERRRASALRASRRPLPTAIPSAAVPEEDELEEGPAFGEEGFGEEGAEFAAKQQAAAQADVAREVQQKRAGQQAAVLAAEEEAQAARQLETGRLGTRRGTRATGAAEKAKAEASERARKELVQRISKNLFRGAKIGTGVTVVMLIVTFAIMNIQMFWINGLRNGKPVELGGLQIPKLDQWELILVIIIDILAIVANPIVLGIIIFVTLFPHLGT